MPLEKLIQVSEKDRYGGKDLQITTEMVEIAFEEMCQRFYFPYKRQDALQEWVDENNPLIDHYIASCSPIMNEAYNAYLVSKCLNLYRASDYSLDDYTEDEQGMWYLVWKATKDIEISGIPIEEKG
tara:strand:- start:3383 stop:3760 length:378 start_codon:yes stop_codon:yes gene_type:complete